MSIKVPKITSRDVAKLAGVSQATVSIVLNNRMDVRIPSETRERVVESARKLGYMLPCTKNRKCYIGVMVPSLVNPFYPQLINDIEEIAADRGLRVLSMNSRRSEDEEEFCLNTLSQQKIIGLIFAYTPFSPNRLREFARTTPVVLMGEEVASLSLDTISFNSVKAGRIMAQHIISLGHKKIAFLSPPIDQTSHSRRNRLIGIKSAMADAGLAEGLKLFIDKRERETHSGNYELDVGYRLGLEVLKDPDITACICVNDITAMGLIQAAWHMERRIPDEIAIAGFDNLLYSRMLTPPLTSIEHHAPQRARLAIDTLLQRSNGAYPNLPLSVEYNPTLICRASTVAKQESV